MSGWRRLVWMAVAGSATACSAIAQTTPALRVDYSHPGLVPARWTLILYPDGRGHFHSERGEAPVSAPQLFDAADADRDVQLSAQFAGHAFQVIQRDRAFGAECESHLKVAFQGWKKFTYSGPDGQRVCEFNYSKDKDVQALGESIVAAAGAILEGARLEKLLQYDRLGLDRELEYVAEALGDGRLQQIGSIRGILERLAEDSALMERVRKRARALLARPVD